MAATWLATLQMESAKQSLYGATHEEVRTKLNEILNDIAKGLYLEPKKDTVEMWLNEWLVTYAFQA